ncbi:MAG: hypothetical protein M1368_01910 [Thaumarchaeota archaeon]|nr:hypothetical protein [Nitrososphaerota archaeon]MDG6908547.1 hypothetical protein [Nitrososphaerota archaeon]
MSEIEEIRKEIIKDFGYFPEFFSPAVKYPRLLESLWKDTKVRYIDNSLPEFWKELLFVYLSKECGNNYCVVVHSVLLMRKFEMTPEAICAVFIGLEKLGVADELKELLKLSLEFYKHPEEVDVLVPKLKQLLGVHYDDWVSFMTFVVAAHRWVEGYAGEISYRNDEFAMKYLHELLDNAEELKRILRLEQDESNILGSI